MDEFNLGDDDFVIAHIPRDHYVELKTWELTYANSVKAKPAGKSRHAILGQIYDRKCARYRLELTFLRHKIFQALDNMDLHTVLKQKRTRRLYKKLVNLVTKTLVEDHKTVIAAQGFELVEDAEL